MAQDLLELTHIAFNLSKACPIFFMGPWASNLGPSTWAWAGPALGLVAAISWRELGATCQEKATILDNPELARRQREIARTPHKLQEQGRSWSARWHL